MWITSHKHKKSGFTLIELLVVIAIIGILSTVASISLVQARRRARDTKRISDIQQVRNGLVIYNNQRATYPPADSPTTPAPLTLGSAAYRCLDESDEGFRASCSGAIIMPRVPNEIQPSSPVYTYSKLGAQEYCITFTLEDEIGNLSGDCRATVEGIECAEGITC